jgi:hypothetical protein
MYEEQVQRMELSLQELRNCGYSSSALEHASVGNNMAMPVVNSNKRLLDDDDDDIYDHRDIDPEIQAALHVPDDEELENAEAELDALMVQLGISAPKTVEAPEEEKKNVVHDKPSLDDDDDERDEKGKQQSL